MKVQVAQTVRKHQPAADCPATAALHAMAISGPGLLALGAPFAVLFTGAVGASGVAKSHSYT
jgi:hypothetical protein